MIKKLYRLVYLIHSENDHDAELAHELVKKLLNNTVEIGFASYQSLNDDGTNKPEKST